MPPTRPAPQPRSGGSSTWAELQKPGRAPSTSPPAHRRGAGAASLAERRGPPPPACHPRTAGPSWGTGTVQGDLATCLWVLKSQAEQDLQREGSELHPTRPPKKSVCRGVRVGCYRPPRRQGGVRAEQGLVPAVGKITPWSNVHPHQPLAWDGRGRVATRVHSDSLGWGGILSLPVPTSTPAQGGHPTLVHAPP